MMFSVVIPTRDRASLLAAALESVWSQSYRDYEVIVVDDGSQDETWHYLQSLGNRVTPIRTAATGAGAARNAGVGRARGEYVAFLDSDDLWFSWTLDAFARAITAANQPSIVCASVVQFADEAELAPLRDGALEAERFADLFASSGRTFLIGSGTVAIRRSLLVECGGFTDLPINGEDQDLLVRLGDRPGFMLALSPPMLAWRRHPGGVTTDLVRALAGSRYLVDQELAGSYPGGAARAFQRREILTRHIRPVSLDCVRRGSIKAGFELYRHSLAWHLALKRWRYVAGFPIAACAQVFSTRRSAS
jgi:glycosyltransferase involved in cell wall biosynthesis